MQFHACPLHLLWRVVHTDGREVVHFDDHGEHLSAEIDYATVHVFELYSQYSIYPIIQVFPQQCVFYLNGSVKREFLNFALMDIEKIRLIYFRRNRVNFGGNTSHTVRHMFGFQFLKDKKNYRCIYSIDDNNINDIRIEERTADDK